MDPEPTLSDAVFGIPPDVLQRAGLHSGARWEGVQRSGRNSYAVRVTLDHVSLEDSVVNGLLEIHGLTPELPSLTTFFEGEIIGDHGPRSGFLTGRWGATEADDMKHWQRFPPFRAIKNQLARPHLNYSNTNKPFVFMRWKEMCVVPPREVQNIHGASYAGFYYLCLDFNTNPLGSPPIEDVRPLSPTSMPRSLRPLQSSSPENSRVRLPTTLPPPVTRAPAHLSPSLSPTTTPEIPEETLPTDLAPAVRPDRPRRASSSAFSYADAAAGRAVSPNGLGLGLPSSPTAPIPVPQPTTGGGGATPKEIEHDVSELSYSPLTATSPSLSAFFPPASSPSSSPSASSPPSSHSATSSPPRPIQIPLPLGASPDDFPVPSSPPLGSHARPRSASGSGSLIGSRQRASNASLDLRGRSSEARVDGELGGRDDKSPARETSTASTVDGGRRRAHRQASSGEREKSGRPLESLGRARMHGFYFYKHSEPYQELALKYVTLNRGGSQAFAFR